jgi:signal recognition particle subunit SRP54
MMKKLRAAGPQGAQKMLQDMMGGGGAPGGMDMGSMMKSMMGGGGGGMPDMSQMQGGFESKSNRSKGLTCSSEAMKMMGGGGGGGGMPGECSSFRSAGWLTPSV